MHPDSILDVYRSFRFGPQWLGRGPWLTGWWKVSDELVYPICRSALGQHQWESLGVGDITHLAREVCWNPPTESEAITHTALSCDSSCVGLSWILPSFTYLCMWESDQKVFLCSTEKNPLSLASFAIFNCIFTHMLYINNAYFHVLAWQSKKHLEGKRPTIDRIINTACHQKSLIHL